MPKRLDSPSPSDDAPRRLRDHPVLGPLPPAHEVAFTFDGRLLEARDGEPIAAALLAAGVRLFRTMPGSGEPRGGYCLVGRCPDCLVVVDGLPNVPACLTPVRAGMRVTTQHGLGDDTWDLADAVSVPPSASTGGGR